MHQQVEDLGLEIAHLNLGVFKGLAQTYGVIAGVIGIVIIAGLVAAALVPTIWWAAILGFGTILGGVGLMGVILFSPLRSLFLWTRNGVRSRLMAGQPHPEGSAGLRRAG